MWCGVGRLDVPFRRRDLCTGEAADLLHQLREVPVGGEHQPHEEAGLCQHTEENDHHQVQAALTLGENEVGVVLWVVYKSVVFFELRSFIRGTVHQSFPDFTFLTGNWIGKLMKLKGEIDPEIAIDLSNKATLAFLQRHLGEKLSPSLPVISLTLFIFCVPSDHKSCLDFAGLEANFNQWDPLIDGQDENLIPGTNVTVLQSAI